jgi:uncharacterized protein (DUF885 family)
MSVRMLKTALIGALWTALVAPCAAYAAESSSARKLHEVFDKYWETVLREAPTYATQIGDTRYNDRLEDLSAAAVQRRRSQRLETIRRLEAIAPETLDDQDRTSRSILLYKLRTVARCGRLLGDLALEPTPYFGNVTPLTQMDGPQFGLPDTVQSTRFASAHDFDDYLKRLAAVPAHVQQLTSMLQAGIDSHWMPPKITLRNVPDQLSSLTNPDPAANPLFGPFKSFPPDLPEAERDRLRGSAETLIRDTVAPAFAALKSFYQRRYMPAARESIAATELPGGAEYYAAVLELNNTTALSPAQIHEIGLREVARIETEMQAIQQRVGFSGGRAEFLKYLWSDPKFFAKTPDEMLMGYRDIAKRIDARLPELFRELPRVPYGIRAMRKEEGDNPEHYTPGAEDGSRAGYFEANTNNLKRVTTWQMADLVMHEAVPGHHLQLARATEITHLPTFRRHLFFPGFGEGWALYAETLGDRIGIYDNPLDKYGQLSADIFRAARLVVDTGMHAMAWSRERAIEYMKDHTTSSDDEIIAEIDRYIVWPGQATAYKIGQLRIIALRDKARSALGGRFDLRAFHNALIDEGELPLAVLEERIDRWIAAQKTAKSASVAH